MAILDTKDFQINIPAQISELQTGQSCGPTITKARNLVFILLTPCLINQQILAILVSKYQLPPPLSSPLQLSLWRSCLTFRALGGATSSVRSRERTHLCSIAWGQWDTGGGQGRGLCYVDLHFLK